jgi:hypothetical protein
VHAFVFAQQELERRIHSLDETQGQGARSIGTDANAVPGQREAWDGMVVPRGGQQL